MKVERVVRKIRDGNVVSALNAVIASRVGESDAVTGVTSTQHVEIIQRGGYTEVREHHSNEKEQS